MRYNFKADILTASSSRYRLFPVSIDTERNAGNFPFISQLSGQPKLVSCLPTADEGIRIFASVFLVT